MGISFLVPKDTTELRVRITWGDYARIERADEDDDGDGASNLVWQRTPREEKILVTLTGDYERPPINVPNSGGLQLYVVEQAIAHARIRRITSRQPPDPFSLFLVNHRKPIVDDKPTRDAPAPPSPDGASPDGSSEDDGRGDEGAPRVVPASADTAFVHQAAHRSAVRPLRGTSRTCAE